jgi:NAD(P) transhydrogenase subunit alpha
MKIVIPTQTDPRCPISPSAVKKLNNDHDIIIEFGAGKQAGITDDAFKHAGGRVTDNILDELNDANILLTIDRPTDDQLSALPEDAVVVGPLNLLGETELANQLADSGKTIIDLTLIPRITRAQSMDVRSSQSNLAGYRAVVEASHHFARALPMMMTAAGTIAPAKTLVMGAGVAGLQAIATAKRLGSVVSATDIRPAVKEQVESLGARFLMVEDESDKDGETEGGYAKEMSEDYKKRQQELIASEIPKQDILITTALIPGRPAPTLISKEMVDQLKPGSVIVDLAAERGGNCPLTQADEIIETDNGVTIIGYTNLPGRIAADATEMLANNMRHFIQFITDEETGDPKLDMEDELTSGVVVAQGGQLTHDRFVDNNKQAA